MLNKNRSIRTGSVIAVVASLLILAVAGWLVTNRQFAFDQVRVWQYQPTSSVATISERAGLSDKGEFYFYASHPEVSNKADFNSQCQRKEANSAILGCYDGNRIYIFDVSNAQLDGVKEVTAAHEMLHVVWERMSQAEQQRVGALLDVEYAKIDDPALIERMAYYDRNEPGEHHNELHSIIATEVSTISGDLETYYGQFFKNRQKVVTLHGQYEAIFNGLKTQQVNLLSTINSLTTELSTLIPQYNSDAANLQRDDQALKNQAGSVDRSDAAQVNAYNTQIRILQTQVAQLATLRDTIESKLATYNNAVATYNTLVVSTNQLTQSLDSTLMVSPSL